MLRDSGFPSNAPRIKHTEAKEFLRLMFDSGALPCDDCTEDLDICGVPFTANEIVQKLYTKIYKSSKIADRLKVNRLKEIIGELFDELVNVGYLIKIDIEPEDNESESAQDEESPEDQYGLTWLGHTWLMRAD